MKKQFLKLVSCLLVVSILLPTTMTAMIPALTVSAAESVLVENRAEEEEREDSKSPTAITGNWKKAKKDGLVPPYGHFHDNVQQFIIDKYGNLSKEHTVTFKAGLAPPGNKSGKGRADLYRRDEETNIAYFWEIKPGSHLAPNKMGEALIQLSRYVEDTVPVEGIDNRFGNTPYPDGERSDIKGDFSVAQIIEMFGEKLGGDIDLEKIEGADISFDGFWDGSGKYAILVAYLPSGLILYWFIRIPDRELPNLEPMPDLSRFWWLFGVPFLDLWQQIMQNPGPPTATAPVPGWNPGNGWNPGYSWNPAPNPVVPGGNPGNFYSPPETSNNPTIGEAEKRLIFFLTGGAVAGVTLVVLENFSTVKPSQIIAWIKAGELSAAEAMAIFITPMFEERPNEYESLSNYVLGDNDDDLSDPNEPTGEDIEDDVNDAGDTPAPRDPLVIDLGNEGILLTSVDNGVYFDLDKNGFAEKTAWIGPEDGFLVLDRNNNGKIDKPKVK